MKHGVRCRMPNYYQLEYMYLAGRTTLIYPLQYVASLTGRAGTVAKGPTPLLVRSLDA